ncbi:Aldo/keto reductase [hydrothermal vent metagenome]|uniref:Aldo/keto reductase n=1 Tax=hydrothermal vent metagenome TaxID=652676 RepID=A0A3B1CPJ0_9ZZZZ
MALTTLGNTALEISPIGLGTWAIGGDWSFGWGAQDDAESIAAIERAVDLGINWIDTAPVYGLGHAEKIVAQALKTLGSARRPLVFTKCGLVWDENKNIGHSLKSDSIRKEVEASLKRLQTEVLDLCQIHWPSFPPGSPSPDLETAWQTLADLITEGKIRHIGVSNFSVEQLERIQKIVPITSLQPPYSPLMRALENDVLPFCEKQNIGVIVYSPMHNGLLSGKMSRERIDTLPDSDWRKKVNPAFREPLLSRNLTFVEILRKIGKHHGRSPGEVAIAWVLRLPAVTGAIVGARNAAQVDGFVKAMNFRLSESEISEIEHQLPDSVNMMDGP